MLSTAATLLDGNPSNNMLKRAAAFNPEGRLQRRAQPRHRRQLRLHLCDRGLVVVDINTPLTPQIVGEVPRRRSEADRDRGPVPLRLHHRRRRFQGRRRDVPGAAAVRATATLADSAGATLYVARTYAYVAAGAQGLVIVDVERPETPRIDQTFNAGGAMNDVHDVKVAMTNASRVRAMSPTATTACGCCRLVSSNETAGAFGFSPRPSPKLIATYQTHAPALAISKGLDRDRAVDESGNQVAVFGRRGGRPLNLEEMRRMYLRDGKGGRCVDGHRAGPPARRGHARKRRRPAAVSRIGAAAATRRLASGPSDDDDRCDATAARRHDRPRHAGRRCRRCSTS